MTADNRQPPGDLRAQALDHWLTGLEPSFEPAQPMGADASFRRYFRARCCRSSFVAMDAPPEHEDTAPFLRVAGVLLALGLRAPRVFAAAPDQGFVLLEDLGEQTFTRALAAGVPESQLYDLACETLTQLQTRWLNQADTLREAADLPRYDDELLLHEAKLFIDWYWPEAYGSPADADTRESFEQAWRSTLAALPELPGVLVLRDFHVDNLMFLPEHTGADACGLLDFQDAVEGSPAYDLVSLLEDARRDVSPQVTSRLLATFADRSPWPKDLFLHHYRVLGVQRSVKIVGIFTRLARRDHKTGYQVHQARLWRLLHQGLKHDELALVAEWFSRHFRADGQPCTR